VRRAAAGHEETPVSEPAGQHPPHLGCQGPAAAFLPCRAASAPRDPQLRGRVIRRHPKPAGPRRRKADLRHPKPAGLR